MGGWMAIPGFWSCGFIPRPSGGVQSRRSNGLAPKQSVRRKKSVVTPSVPATYGRNTASRSPRAKNTASAEYIDRIRHQKSSDPDCPAQKAVKV
jgi:hypothetical protein